MDTRKLLPLILAGCFVPGLSTALADEPAPQAEDPGPLTEAQVVEGDVVAEAPAAEAEAEAGDLTEEQLRREVAELERELNEARNRMVERRNQEQEAAEDQLSDEDRLAQITLPAEPTREDCEAYIEALRELTAGRRSFSSADPIVGKLREVPIENMDLVINEVSTGTSLRFYANYAMRGVDTSGLRERFVNDLEENPANIGIIVMHGWVEDVRDIVIDRIETADADIAPAWFQAAVELNEPQLYPKLHEITIGSRYAAQFINMLQLLPDYDLAHTVHVCWDRSLAEQMPVRPESLAPVAAQFGEVEALGILINRLNQNTSYMASANSHNAFRTSVLQLIEFRGSNDEILAWYQENREDLVFDYLHQRFVLPQAF